MAKPAVALTKKSISSFRAAVAFVAPDLEAVEFWLTRTIEDDFVARGVFLELRGASAVMFRGGASLHFVSRDVATAMLRDSICRAASVTAGLLNSHHNHRQRLETALIEASQRRAMFESASAKRAGHWGDQEDWVGTAAQFRAMGICVDRPFPGEDGCTTRSVSTKDSRGYPARVVASTGLWPGLFDVDITLPKDSAGVQAKSAESQALELAGLPSTREELRNQLILSLWSVGQHVKREMQALTGYRYSQQSFDDFSNAILRAYEVLKEGEIVGRSRSEEIQHAAMTRAKSDGRLQDFLRGVTTKPLEDSE